MKPQTTIPTTLCRGSADLKRDLAIALITRIHQTSITITTTPALLHYILVYRIISSIPNRMSPPQSPKLFHFVMIFIYCRTSLTSGSLVGPAVVRPAEIGTSTCLPRLMRRRAPPTTTKRRPRPVPRPIPRPILGESETRTTRRFMWTIGAIMSDSWEGRGLVLWWIWVVVMELDCEGAELGSLSCCEISSYINNTKLYFLPVPGDFELWNCSMV